MFNRGGRKHWNKVSRAERNAIKEAEKKRSARLIVLRDCAVVLICMFLVFAYVSSTSQITTEPEYAFAGGTSKNVPVYLIGIPDEETSEEADAEEDESEDHDSQDGREAEPVVVGKLVRGSTVKKLIDFKELNGVMYCRVENTGIDGAGSLYMKADNLVSSIDEVVQETKVYVRTPVTIYAEESGPAIASFAAKGTELKVTGYDQLLTDGSVHKYKVAYGEGDDAGEGYVYSKYIVSSAKSAKRYITGQEHTPK